VNLTFNQLTKIIGQSHLLSHILLLFGWLITLIIFSFAIDYTALFLIDASSFKIANVNGFSILFEMFYFSTITFSLVGYGDVVPISFTSKSLVILEVGLLFFVLVFGIANINRIRVNK